MNGLTKTLQMLFWLQGDGIEIGDHEKTHDASNRTVAPSGTAKNNGRQSFTRGLRADAILIATEDAGEFDRLRSDFEQQFAPQAGLEEELVDRMAGLVWRLRRTPKLEAAVIEARTTEVIEANSSRPDGFKAVLGLAIIGDSEKDAIGKLSRHDNALMNGFTKTLELLLLSAAASACGRWKSSNRSFAEQRSGCTARLTFPHLPL